MGAAGGSHETTLYAAAAVELRVRALSTDTRPMPEPVRVEAAIVAIEPRLETEWDDLAVRTGAAPFARPAWVRAWTQASGLPVSAATVRLDGVLAAVLPIVERRRWVRTAADWHVPMLEAVFDDREALDHLVEHLLAGRRRVTVDFVLRDGATALAFAEGFDRRGFRVRTRTRLASPFVEFGGEWEDYANSLSTKKWRELRRRRRRLAEQGPVEFDVRDGSFDLDRLLSEGFAIEGSGWKTLRGTAIASDRSIERFYRQVSCWAANDGMARVSLLRVGGRPIAFDLSIVHGGVEWLLKTGFDPEWAAYSPGSLLRAEALRTAFEEKVRLYEFAGSAEAWKLEWTAATRDIVVLDGYAPGLGGAVALQVSRVKRRIRTLRSKEG